MKEKVAQRNISNAEMLLFGCCFREIVGSGD